MNQIKKIITIDGFASSGKTTLSRHLSKKMNWPWFSSGVLYRGISYIKHLENLTDEECIAFIQSKDWQIKMTPEKTLFVYKDKDITDELYKTEIDKFSSHISANQDIRKALIPIQRGLYKEETGLIMEGRDSGTVIFPEAPLKIFLEASEKIRAQRRQEQRSENVSSEEVLKHQKERDKRDQTRSFAPLRKPENAQVFSSETHNIEEMTEKAYQQAQSIFLNA